MEDLEELVYPQENSKQKRKIESKSEGFFLQLIQDGLDSLHCLLSSLSDHLLSLSLDRVQHQQLFGKQFFQTTVSHVCFFADKLINIFMKQENSAHDFVNFG